MNIFLVRRLLKEEKVKWTSHSLERIAERDISIEDINKCINEGEIIEDYPDDYPFPSCLIFGYNLRGKVIHVVVGSDEEVLYIITAYYPDFGKFREDLKTRR